MIVACPRCYLQIDCSGTAAQVVHCPQCGQGFESPEPPFVPATHTAYRTAIVSTPQRSPGVAAVLSFFLPGVGQIYNGEIVKGLCVFFFGFLAAPLAAAFVVFVGSTFASGNSDRPGEALAGVGLFALIAVVFVFSFWLWGIYDAYVQAEYLNRRRR